MYKALIVDDEPLMIDVLRNIIDWREAGFEIVEEAFNGEEALKIINSRPVDVVLTDLKMPLMNGLDLVLNTRTVNPAIKFIVVSAYDEFHMVSSAFKLGVEEYLLKDEMTGEQVLGVLSVMKEKLNQEEEKRARAERQKMLEQEAYLNTQKLMRHMNLNQDVIREKMLKDIIWGGAAEDSAKPEMPDLIRLNNRRKCMLCIRIDDYQRLETQVWEGNSELLHHSILNIIDETLDNRGIGDAFRKAHGEYVAILCFEDAMSETAVRETTYSIGNEIKRSIERRLHAVAVCGASETATGMKCLQKLYGQAYSACRYSFVQGKDRMIFFDGLPKTGADLTAEFAESANRLKEFLANIKNEDGLKAVNELCVSDSQVYPGNVDDVKRLYDKYNVYLSDFIEQHQLGDALRDSVGRYSSYIREYGGLKELNEWLKGSLAQLTAAVGEGNQLINRAKRFINKHYGENISLSDVANQIGVNASYLSRTFTRETGDSLMEYLAKVRMEVAANYIRTTDLKIYEIAEKVGYTNAEHFSRMFKKVTGKSPREFLS